MNTNANTNTNTQVNITEQEIVQILGELNWLIVLLKKQLVQANKTIEILQKELEKATTTSGSDKGRTHT